MGFVSLTWGRAHRCHAFLNQSSRGGEMGEPSTAGDNKIKIKSFRPRWWQVKLVSYTCACKSSSSETLSKACLHEGQKLHMFHESFAHSGGFILRRWLRFVKNKSLRRHCQCIHVGVCLPKLHPPNYSAMMRTGLSALDLARDVPDVLPYLLTCCYSNFKARVDADR